LFRRWLAGFCLTLSIIVGGMQIDLAAAEILTAASTYLKAGQAAAI
jgi:hypothetical protein